MVIVTDPDIAKEARYAGCIAADVFGQARKDPRVIAGRTMRSEQMLTMARRWSRGNPRFMSRITGDAFRTVRLEGQRAHRFHLHRPEVVSGVIEFITKR